MADHNQFNLMQFDEFDILMQNVNSQSLIDGLNFLDDHFKNNEDTASYVLVENPLTSDSDYHEISSVSSTTTSSLFSSQKETPYSTESSSLDELIDQVISSERAKECILDLSELDTPDTLEIQYQNNDSCIDLEQDNSDSDDLQTINELKITEEEKLLLLKEGHHVPTRLPLTKSEEKALKLVRRKIRNKKSAKTSRERKKTYIEGLEKRVDACTKENKFLHDQIKVLKAQNSELATKLQKMQKCLLTLLNKSNKPKISVCVLFVSFLVTFCVYPLFDSKQTQVTSEIAVVPHENSIQTNARRLMSSQNTNLIDTNETGGRNYALAKKNYYFRSDYLDF